MGSDRSEGEWMDMTTGLVMKSSKGVVWTSKHRKRARCMAVVEEQVA
jgi:hypothetical protein